MRLIDADDVFARIPNNLPYRASVRRVLMQAGEVDAVPVVRCRDCDNRVYINMGDEIGVVGGCGIYGAALPEDFYCAIGERMTDEADRG